MPSMSGETKSLSWYREVNNIMALQSSQLVPLVQPGFADDGSEPTMWPSSRYHAFRMSEGTSDSMLSTTNLSTRQNNNHNLSYSLDLVLITSLKVIALWIMDQVPPGHKYPRHYSPRQ